MPLFDYFHGLPCSAPLKIPPLLPNATLLTVILFIRHGMRAPAQLYHFPGNEGVWNCNGIKNTTKFTNVQVNGEPYKYMYYDQTKDYLFPPSCKRSALIDQGVKELYELGQLYYNYSLDRQIITSNEDTPITLSKFSIRSSFAPRCIESIISFLDGFFYKHDGKINQVIHIETGKENAEPLSASPFHSKVILEHLLEFIKNDDYKKRYNISENIIKKLQGKYLNVTYPVHEFESLTFGDFVNAVRCAKQEEIVYRTANHEKPKNDEEIITVDSHKKVMSNVLYLEKNLFNYSPESVVPIFELVLKKLKKNEKILNLFSAHSETLSALMVALGIEREFPPPYRSHLLMEVWKPVNSEPVLMVFLNGELMKSMELSEYVRFSEDLINENKKEKINNDETPVINEKETKSVNEEETELINTETKSVNVDENEQINEEETKSVNVDENEQINEEETKSVNVDENEPFNEEETKSVNVDENEPFNEEETKSVNVDENEPFNEKETKSVNEEETELINTEETKSVNVDENEQINEEETKSVNVDENEPFNEEETKSVNVDENEPVNESDIDLVIMQKKIEIIKLTQLNDIFNFVINETNSEIAFIYQASDQVNSIFQQTDQIYEKMTIIAKELNSQQVPIELRDLYIDEFSNLQKYYMQLMNSAHFIAEKAKKSHERIEYLQTLLPT